LYVCKFLLETSDQAEILQVTRVYYTLYTEKHSKLYSFVSRIRGTFASYCKTVSLIISILTWNKWLHRNSSTKMPVDPVFHTYRDTLSALVVWNCLRGTYVYYKLFSNTYSRNSLTILILIDNIQSSVVILLQLLILTAYFYVYQQ